MEHYWFWLFNLLAIKIHSYLFHLSRGFILLFYDADESCIITEGLVCDTERWAICSIISVINFAESSVLEKSLSRIIRDLHEVFCLESQIYGIRALLLILALENEAHCGESLFRHNFCRNDLLVPKHFIEFFFIIIPSRRAILEARLHSILQGANYETVQIMRIVPDKAASASSSLCRASD